MYDQHKAVSMPLVHQVLDVRRWERRDEQFRYEGLSRHGYVVQCTLEGRCWHVSSGRGYELSRGSVVWLDDVEEHMCEVREAPWVFCSIQFLAPHLPLPQIETCTRRVGKATVDRFIELLAVWDEQDMNTVVRALRVQAIVADILSDVLSMSKPQPFTIDETTKPWWELEVIVRRHFDQPICLSDLEEWSGLSRNALSALSRHATGTSPMKRIKHLKLQQAASLLISSDLRVGEVANRVGYPRIHEFSRDFRKAFDMPPRAYRNASREQHAAQGHGK